MTDPHDPESLTENLSRRERQVMDILHRRGEATVAEIMAELPDPPSYSAVRSILRILGEKGTILFREDGPRYVYYAAMDGDTVRNTALNHLVDTYFGGSPGLAVTALLNHSDLRLNSRQVARLRDLIETARRSEGGSHD